MLILVCVVLSAVMMVAVISQSEAVKGVQYETETSEESFLVTDIKVSIVAIVIGVAVKAINESING